MTLIASLARVVAVSTALGTQPFLATKPAAVRCACCADPGTWNQETRRVTAEEFAEIGRINLASTAFLYLGPAGLEIVKGVVSASESYRVVHHKPTRDWRIELEDEPGHRGEIRFTIPDRATFHVSDPQDGLTDGTGGPILTKELRLTGSLSGTGPFKGGTYRLILNGRGNVCATADEFTSWILQVEGAGVDYALFGKLDPPRARPGISPPVDTSPLGAQDARDRQKWERATALEDEFFVQLLMKDGLDPERAERIRRILFDARASRRADAARARAADITIAALGTASARLAVETDRQLARILTTAEFAQKEALRADAHLAVVVWLASARIER